MPNGWSTLAEVSVATGMTRSQLHRRVDNGKLPVSDGWDSRGKKCLLVSDEDLAAFISALQQPVSDNRRPYALVREAAAATGLEGAQIRRLCDKGELEHTRSRGNAGEYRINRKSLQALVDKLANGDTEAA